MGRNGALPALVWPCVPLLLALPAAAQSPSIDALLRTGVEQRRTQRDADALATFTTAWERCRCAEARVQMALAAQALGRWCDAAGLLDDALSDPADPYIRPLRAQLEEERRAIAAHVGSVRVEVDAPSARITLDDAPVAPAPVAHCAAVGPHSLAVTAPGRVALARPIAVDPGARLDLGLTLLPLPVAPTPPVPSPWPARARTARWITLGTSALTLAAAVTATAIEGDQVARWHDDTRCLADGLSRAENCSDALAAADRAHAVAVAGYVTAGALAATTVALWVISARTPRTRERSRAMCLPDLRAAGVLCAGAF